MTISFRKQNRYTICNTSGDENSEVQTDDNCYCSECGDTEGIVWADEL